MSKENKFKEATGFYEPIVRKHFDRWEIFKISLDLQLVLLIVDSWLDVNLRLVIIIEFLLLMTLQLRYDDDSFEWSTFTILKDVCVCERKSPFT
jgi:hypothetical protein